MVAFTVNAKGNVAELWRLLSSPENAQLANVAALELANCENVVEFIQQQLQALGDTERNAREMVAKLDAEQFEVREQATTKLIEWASQTDAVSALLRQRSKDGGMSVEAQMRIGRILKASAAQKQNVSPRNARAVQVLEQIGTSQAQELLRILATKDSNGLLAREARAALDRVQRRPAQR
jgi:hypothetical protein